MAIERMLLLFFSQRLDYDNWGALDMFLFFSQCIQMVNLLKCDSLVHTHFKEEEEKEKEKQLSGRSSWNVYKNVLVVVVSAQFLLNQSLKEKGFLTMSNKKKRFSLVQVEWFLHLDKLEREGISTKKRPPR